MTLVGKPAGGRAAGRAVLPVAALALALVACGRLPGPAPAEPAARPQVVIVSAAGKVATSTPVGGTTRVPPTPTFEVGFASILTPLAGTTAAETATAAVSPTPEVRPTRTPVPTVTPFPTIELPPPPERPIFTNPPTRTPAPPPPQKPGQAAPTRVPTKVPTATPVDPNERGVPNSDIANAVPITPGKNLAGVLNGPSAVDVYSFDVDAEEGTITVTLSGQGAEGYRLYLISPGRGQSAFGRPVGSTGRRITYPIRGEIGTWYVEVSADGKRVPGNGRYSLRVDVRETLPPVDELE